MRPGEISFTATMLIGARSRLVVETSEGDGTSSDARKLARWAGRNVELDPGLYRLRLQLRGAAKAPFKPVPVEISVVLCPGWQTQVFLLRQPDPLRPRAHPVIDLLDATQLMAPIWHGFEPRGGVKRPATARHRRRAAPASVSSATDGA